MKPARVTGTFAFTQGEIVPLNQIARFMGLVDEYLCAANAVTQDAGALAQAGEWTISVGGAVAHPFDASIEEMADEASQTTVFDVNGSPIAESMGGVNQLWLGSTSARYFARDIVSITVESRDEVPAAPTAGDAAEASANLPNVGVFFGGEVE